MRRAVPSLITLAVVLCALVAILWSPHRPYWACNCIIAASLLDMIDGRVARMLGAQTELGAQLDSLADVIAFGVAPAILAYYWIGSTAELAPGIDASLVVCFAFVACAAIRLARFNVAGSGATRTFTGIPTPVAALAVTTLVMAWHELSWEPLRNSALVLGVVGGAAVLMVAPLTFPSFKSFRSRWLAILYFGSMAGGVTMLFLGLPGGSVLLGLIVIYIGRGAVGLVLGGAGATDSE